MSRYPIFAKLRGRLYPDSDDTGDMPMVLLMYLAFLLMPWIMGEQASMPMTLMSVALFLPIYFLAWRRELIVPASLGMWLLWFVFARYNWASHTYMIYACAFVATIPNGKRALTLCLAYVCAFVAVIYAYDAPLVAYMPCFFSAIAYLGNRNMMENMRRQAILRLSQHEISKLAQRSERERIARDVHDLLGHSLTLITLKADLARKILDVNPAQARVELEQITSTAREALSEVRATVHGMRAPQLSVEISKSKLACEASHIELQIDNAEIELPREVEAVFAAILREAINNVVKHARATKAVISLRTNAQLSTLSVQDNGKVKHFKMGHGLSAMRERIEEIGGELSISTESGFRIVAGIQQPALVGASVQLSAQT